MSVSIEALVKNFGAVKVLKSVTETFAASEISVLLGSSGCGKTTTLRCIAGLERPTAGTIRIGGRVVSNSGSDIYVPVEKRQLAMVFQSYAIWPHMNVFENVSLPLKAARVPREQIRTRVNAALEMVGLGGLGERSATRLSGGQQQRVALARCVVSDAPVVLMDEPLSNLDAKLRVAMRGEIKQLQQKLEKTIIFVTHDQEEALSIANTVYLFRDGQIVQKGDPSDIYDRPASRYVAEFLGKANIIETGSNPESIRALVGTTDFARAQTADTALCIRPEKIRMTSPGTDALAGRIEFGMFLGERSEYRVSTPLGPISVVETGNSARPSGAEVGLSASADDVRMVRHDA